MVHWPELEDASGAQPPHCLLAASAQLPHCSYNIQQQPPHSPHAASTAPLCSILPRPCPSTASMLLMHSPLSSHPTPTQLHAAAAAPTHPSHSPLCTAVNPTLSSPTLSCTQHLHCPSAAAHRCTQLPRHPAQPLLHHCMPPPHSLNAWAPLNSALFA